MRNSEAIKNKEEVYFDPCITLKDKVSDGFRVFAGAAHGLPANQLNQEQEPSEVTIFISGESRLDNDGELLTAGAIWYEENDPRNRPVRVQSNLASKTAGEPAAILSAIQDEPQEATLHFKLQSTRLIRMLTTDLELWEAKDWLGASDPTLVKAIVAALRGRGTKCSFCEISEPETNTMKKVKDLAVSGLDGAPPDHINTEIPEGYMLSGISLAKGTQSSFYRAIKSKMKKVERMKTTVMLDITRHAVKDLTGSMSTDEEIWWSIRDKDITRTTREFMFKCLHQAYKCGEYWKHITNFEHWGICQTCGVDESIEHVLLECTAPGQSTIWNLAEELWRMTGYDWPDLRVGTILGSALSNFKRDGRKRDTGANRLFKILITESAHEIWILRCNRVITNGSDPEKFPSEQEIHNKWLFRINHRLRMDQLMANSFKFEKQALNYKTVESTWKSVLMDTEKLSEHWIWQSGVLVGILPLRPPGRNR
jgi:ribonuclease HI